ncbi:MAG: Mu-like prophage major head subunit gpT family protein [Phycisphaerae bacterium]
MEDTLVTEDLLLSAAIDTRKMPSVSILAYAGGIMKVAPWGNIVIDLAALDVAGSVAILSDHDSSRRGVVGHGEAMVKDGRLVVAGSISAGGQAAREIVDAAKNGFPWQASVGVEVLEHRRVAAGETAYVNGNAIKAPAGGLTLVARGRLREVSIVGLGCDTATTVAIAASKDKERNMDVAVEETKVKDTEMVEASETKRLADIKRICGTRHSDIKARAVAEKWDTARTELEVLRADRPRVPASHIVERPGGPAVLEAAILSHMGKMTLGEKVLGAAAMDGASLLGATSMLDLCRTALHMDGVDVPRGRMEMVKASLSTYSLPTALGNVANKVLLDAYNETPATWRSFCAIRSVADFKTNTAIRPSFLGGLERVAPGGELKHGTAGEWTMQYAIDTFGKLLSVDRRDIINDDLGVFNDSAAALGRAAMRKLSDLAFDVLLANANSFFGVGNGNYMDGADAALAMDSLAKAITLMRTQTDAEGNNLDLKPATLLVGPELEPVARALLNSEFIQRAVDVPTGNSLRQAVNLEVEPRLSNTKKYGSAASAKHWYLFAAPSAAAMIVAFLNGQQSPTTEFFGLEQSVERLAVSWRVYFDFGSALCDPRAAVRSKGQA